MGAGHAKVPWQGQKEPNIAVKVNGNSSEVFGFYAKYMEESIISQGLSAFQLPALEVQRVPYMSPHHPGGKATSVPSHVPHDSHPGPLPCSLQPHLSPLPTFIKIKKVENAYCEPAGPLSLGG